MMALPSTRVLMSAIAAVMFLSVTQGAAKAQNYWVDFKTMAPNSVVPAGAIPIDFDVQWANGTPVVVPSSVDVSV